ncbi:hypothetical protein B0H17DRAFT_1197210 [Mycena rosella]|uniref:Uncharacterized protein n=1 Tax=Mycena rosella TaxID=1033263 RepID=A0AAD7DU71_MYCRO|nr:hypothetical protein B0H17DRAFT_1197210 [Mycena rosella]
MKTTGTPAVSQAYGIQTRFRCPRTPADSIPLSLHTVRIAPAPARRASHPVPTDHDIYDLPPSSTPHALTKPHVHPAPKPLNPVLAPGPCRFLPLRDRCASSNPPATVPPMCVCASSARTLSPSASTCARAPSSGGRASSSPSPDAAHACVRVVAVCVFLLAPSILPSPRAFGLGCVPPTRATHVYGTRPTSHDARASVPDAAGVGVHSDAVTSSPQAA